MYAAGRNEVHQKKTEREIMDGFPVMLRFSLFLVLSCCAAIAVHAQTITPAPPLAHVQAVPAGTVKAGGSLKLVVNVSPRQGIHIYAPPQKEFKPISLTLEAAPGVKVGKPRFPAAVTRSFEGEAVKVYDKAFSITVPVVLPPAANAPAWVRGKLLYQACDDLVCYRPITADVRWDIQLQ
jgi:DsbC/DsbD-like thiol-disulfide interchange protein